MTHTTAAASPTLVGRNGAWVLVPVALPAVLTIVMWIGLHRKRTTGGRAATAVVAAAFVVLGCLNLVAILSVGVFLLPVTALLGWTAATTPAAPGPQGGARRELGDSGAPTPA